MIFKKKTPKKTSLADSVVTAGLCLQGEVRAVCFPDAPFASCTMLLPGFQIQAGVMPTSNALYLCKLKSPVPVYQPLHSIVERHSSVTWVD